MQIRRITNKGRVVSRLRARRPTAAPHAREGTEGVRLTALADSHPIARDCDTVEVWLDARSLAAIDAVREDRPEDKAILEDARRYRKACAAVNRASRAYQRAPTPATSAALTEACSERTSAEIALKLSARGR